MSDRTSLQIAIKIAEIAHYEQFDKGGVDYIQHPLRVMLMGATEEERIVGVLHDVIEDSNITHEALKKVFGDIIADAVFALSRKSDESYMQFIRRTADNMLAARVKIHDLKDNMDIRRIKNPTHIDLQRSKKYARALKVLEVAVATGTIDVEPLREVA